MTTFKEASCDRKYISLFPSVMTQAKSYEDFVASLEFVDGRAELYGFVSTIGGCNNHTVVFSNSSITDYQEHIQRMKDEGYIVQRLDTSNNFFIIAETTFIYKPEFRRKAYWDAHPFRLMALQWLGVILFISLIIGVSIWGGGL